MSSNDDDPNASAKSDRDRRDRIRNRHDRAAKDGRHLPSLAELLAGGSFMAGDIYADSKAYAERLMPRVDTATLPGAEVHAALAMLTCHPRMADFEVAAAVCRRANNPMNYLNIESPPEDGRIANFRGPDLNAIATRLDFYAAALGSKDGCIRIAGHAVSLAQQTGPADVCQTMFEAAIGWLAAADDAREVTPRRGIIGPWDDMRIKAQRAATVLVDETLKFYAAVGADAAADTKEKPPTNEVRSRYRPGAPNPQRALDIDCDLEEIMEMAESAKAPGIIVIKEIGSPATHEGKKIVEAYKPVVGVRLPLSPLPNIAAVRRSCQRSFLTLTQ